MPLSKSEAAGMTLNERLFATGTIGAFEDAVQRRDVAELRRMLLAVHVEEPDVAEVIESLLDPDWAVRFETARRFQGRASQQATDMLLHLTLPFLDTPDRALERARVRMALVKLAAGDAAALRGMCQQAEVDWRDVLVAAGLAGEDWREVLVREGFAVPRGTREQGDLGPRP